MVWLAVSHATNRKAATATNGSKTATVQLGKRKGQPAYQPEHEVPDDAGPSRPQPPAKKARPGPSSSSFNSAGPKGKGKAAPETPQVLESTDEDEDDDDFVFTTVPYHSQSSQSQTRAPAASTSGSPVYSPRGTTRFHPLLHDNSQAGSNKSIALNVAETPKIKRNKALRNGEDHVTEGGSQKQNNNNNNPPSASRRGRRGSSIGSGQFDATPHPSLPDDALYKHIDPMEPPATRFLTLSAWTARRAKDVSSKPSSSSRSRKSADAEADAVASQLMESWIQDLCAKRVDLSWPDPLLASPSKSRPPEQLLPNPKNQVLRDKMQELEDWTNRAAHEDEVRRQHMKQYSHLRDAGARAAAAAAAEASRPPQIPNLSLPFSPSDLQNPDQILQLGREARAASSRSAERQRRRSGLPPEPPFEVDTVNVQQELGLDMENLRLQASHASTAVHRLEQLVDTAREFVDHRLKRATGALQTQRSAALSDQPSGTASSSGHQSSSSLLRSALPSGQSSELVGMDIGSVLRAIARDDLGKRG